MKSVKKLSVYVLVSCFLAACGTTSQRAPIEDRSIQRLPAVSPTGPNGAKGDDSRSFYVVKKGDTLRQIALERGQNYSDIVAWNNLANPNDIKVGQSLRIAAPAPDAASGTSAVVSSGVEVRPLGAAGSSESTADNSKNGPRADKRPYSDATLAEMQKSDSVADKNPTKTTDKSADKPAITDEIVWIWPVEGKVVANFDDNKNKGIDLSGTLGQDVFAAAAGTVMYAGSGIRGFGNLVIIKHSNNFLSAYAHNRKILVKEKQAISRGQKIAEMGNSDTDSVKLHFEIRQQGKPVDPLKFLPAR